MWQNSPLSKITLATTICGEGDFLIYKGLYNPLFYK